MAQRNSSNILLTIKQARKTGNLNLTGRNLDQVPPEVWSINSEPSNASKLHFMDGKDDDKWWEQSDLTKLNISSNNLTVIGEGLSNLKVLTVLDLHDNQLREFEQSIFELSHLTHLDLSRNKITSIPDDIYKLKELKSLNISNNNISTISDFISSLACLEDVQLQNNNIQSLPDNFGELTGLYKLNASHNKLKELPPSFYLFQSLRTLDLTHNQLVRVEIQGLHRLELLYIRHNKLEDLPTFESCHSLKEIYAGNNRLKSINNQIVHNLAKSLIVLDIRDNKLNEISSDIVKLTELQRLDLTNNNLSNIPNELGLHKKLRNLVLEGNPLRSIRQDIIRRGTGQLLKFLASRIDDKALLMEQQQQSHTSAPMPGMASDTVKVKQTANQSKVFDVSGKNLPEITETFWGAAGDCTIQNVNFSKNQLQSVPEKKNLLSELPDEVSNLNNLREIRLAYNKFSIIPSCLYACSSLEIIDISNNGIGVINHEGIRKMEKLAVLELSNNDLTQIPPELGLATQLRSLTLDGNRLRVPRPAIIAKGTIAILEYLRGRITE
ncbi:DgyrCDS9033 [Dimorphilus gyrociliatus]|uniref:DgyrCDS9033 n=1 Tax=Dimorphilus gyrociliatus TaxID=2664684 RepID=A0A7I8VXN0_9ANNE|nr:DgyrCDS9033 [Dimorphilus gyrociliatus]